MSPSFRLAAGLLATAALAGLAPSVAAQSIGYHCTNPSLSDPVGYGIRCEESITVPSLGILRTLVHDMQMGARWLCPYLTNWNPPPPFLGGFIGGGKCIIPIPVPGG